MFARTVWIFHPFLSLLNKDKSRLSLGINRLAYPREKSLTLEILRLAQNIELGEEHEDDQSKRLPIVYVQRKRDGWFSRLYIKKKNEFSYDVFLFQKFFDRINLSDTTLQNITNEVKKLELPIGVTIMDCELCHAEAEGHHLRTRCTSGAAGQVGGDEFTTLVKFSPDII